MPATRDDVVAREAATGELMEVMRQLCSDDPESGPGSLEKIYRRLEKRVLELRAGADVRVFPLDEVEASPNGNGRTAVSIQVDEPDSEPSEPIRQLGLMRADAARLKEILDTLGWVKKNRVEEGDYYSDLRLALGAAERIRRRLKRLAEEE